MGEAKRRRLLDPNYGQAKMPSDLEGIQSDLFSQQNDLVMNGTKKSPKLCRIRVIAFNTIEH
jgi:hypothetical protein